MTDPGNLYLLVDGTHADPAECSKGADGVLRHKNGMAVAMRGTGEPQTVGEDAVLNKNVEAAEAGKPAEEAAETNAEAVAPPPASAPVSPQPAVVNPEEPKPAVPRDVKVD